MTIADLFVNIGVKGTDTTVKAISNVNTGMKEVASTGLAAKAAIVGIVYGLERLTGMASARGMELQQFAGATGLSIENLQKWQFAARQFGVQNEEVAGSIKSVQTAMTDMLLGKGAPAGFGFVASKVGLDPTRLRDTFYVMEKLQRFAKEVPPDIAANVLKSFGISDTMFQFLAKNKQDIDKVRPSNIFSEREVAALAKIDTAWSNLYNRFKMVTGGIVAAKGLAGVNILSGAFSGTDKFLKDLDKLTKGMETFRTSIMAVAAAIALSFAPITATVAGAILLLNEYNKMKNGDQTSVFGREGAIANIARGRVLPDIMKNIPQTDKDQWKNANFLPRPPQSKEAVMKEVNNTVNQVLNIHGVEGAEDAASESKKGLNDAVRQMSVQGAVN